MFKNMRLVILFDIFLNPSFKMATILIFLTSLITSRCRCWWFCILCKLWWRGLSESVKKGKFVKKRKLFFQIMLNEVIKICEK